MTGCCCRAFRGNLRLADALVNLCSGLPLHIVRDVGVDVQCGGAGDVADDSGEGLHIHPMFQRVGSENVSEIVEADAGQTSLFQKGFQPQVGGVWIDRLLRPQRIWKYPFSQRALFLLCRTVAVLDGNTIVRTPV